MPLPTNLPILDPVGSNKEVFNKYLKETDPCFARHYSKSAKECKACNAPVITNGKLCLLKEVCAAACAGSEKPATIKELSGQDIMSRLQAGKTVQQVFTEIVDGGDVAVVGAKARALLSKRLRYYKNEGIPVPSVPLLKELMKDL